MFSLTFFHQIISRFCFCQQNIIKIVRLLLAAVSIIGLIPIGLLEALDPDPCITSAAEKLSLIFKLVAHRSRSSYREKNLNAIYENGQETTSCPALTRPRYIPKLITCRTIHTFGGHRFCHSNQEHG